MKRGDVYIAPVLYSPLNLQNFWKDMNIYKHTAVSLAASTLLQFIFRKLQMSIACFLTGVFIDLDHIFDYYMNQELRKTLGYLLHPRQFFVFLREGYEKDKPADKIYKALHSVELLIPISVLYIFGIWNDIATGMLTGFVLHLVMDAIPLGHIGTISIIYKLKNGFPTGGDIVKQRLSRIGVDLSKCQSCGAEGETILHKNYRGYAGFTKKGLKKTMVLCEECHDRMHNEED
jgi:hypothetical protein